MRFVKALKRRLSKNNQSQKVNRSVQGAMPIPGLPSDAKFRVAVIGAGPQGRDQCMGLKQIPQVELAAVADRRPESLEWIKVQVALPSMKGYSDSSALFAQEKLDLVCIATNTVSHLLLAEQAAEAGVPRIIVEKPIGNSVARARRFQKLCEAKGIKVTVNHNRRWYGDYAGIKRCIAQGFIGELRAIHATPGPGGLAMIGSHFLDLIAYLGDSPIAWVSGHLIAETQPNRRGAEYQDPTGFCQLALKNGVRGALDVCEDLTTWEGSIVLRGSQGRIEVDERAKEWHLITSAFGRQTLPFSDSTRINDCFAKVAREILSPAPSSCDIATGIHSLEAVMAVHYSAQRQNSPVVLPLTEAEAEWELPFP